MEAKELRGMSTADLTEKLSTLREEIGHLALKRATSRLENPMKLKETKRELARVATILREKALQSEERLSMEGRGLQKERSGLVVSDKMAKTVVVSIERTVTHPRYKKILRRRTSESTRRNQSVPSRRPRIAGRMPASQS